MLEDKLQTFGNARLFLYLKKLEQCFSNSFDTTRQTRDASPGILPSFFVYTARYFLVKVIFCILICIILI